jgi:hypothetical protein
LAITRLLSLGFRFFGRKKIAGLARRDAKGIRL